MFFADEYGNTKGGFEVGLLTTMAYKFGAEEPHCALEGSIAITGARAVGSDNLGLIRKVRHRVAGEA
jgi:glycerol kinase